MTDLSCRSILIHFFGQKLSHRANCVDRSIVPVEESLVVGTLLESLLVQGLDEPLEGVYGLDTIDGGALRCDSVVK